jgi:hypothetical protein
MVTGDHPVDGAAIADEVGLRAPTTPSCRPTSSPRRRGVLGALLDHDGVVVARVSPEDKLRIARALRARGHVVAMTGDGVNDGPALHEADIGIAMGASGTDVAREAADLVLLDDHFASIVAGIEQGRATFVNVRRFLTYHLTDNVAELTPFVVWALSGGRSRSPSACCRSSPSTSAPTPCPPSPSAPSRRPATCSTGHRCRASPRPHRRPRAFGVLGPCCVARSIRPRGRPDVRFGPWPTTGPSPRVGWRAVSAWRMQ